MRTCKRDLLLLFCFFFLILLVSTSLQAAIVMVGDFETNINSWVPDNTVPTAYSTQSATQTACSLQVTFPSGHAEFFIIPNSGAIDSRNSNDTCGISFVGAANGKRDSR